MPARRSATYITAELVHAVLDRDLHVTILHGRPTVASARELIAILERAGYDRPRWSLFDASAVEAIAADGFAVLTEHLNRRREELAAVVQRQAIVSPRGMTGAVVTGYRAVFEFPYPVAYFSDRTQALEHLGRGDLREEVEALAAVAAVDPLVRRLRELLAASPAISLPVAARRLVVSQRTLQRRLEAAGTSLGDEVRAARIALAKQALVETDRKLDEIAHEVGCASLQSFSSLFRRATGEAPSTYRARWRAR